MRLNIWLWKAGDNAWVKYYRVPTQTGKIGRHFPVRESQGILIRLEKSGKITQNTGKFREFQTNTICYFLVIFKLTVYYLLKWIKFSVKKTKLKKILEKWKKYWKKSGNFVSPEKWEPRTKPTSSFPFSGYRCCYCYTFNPARKQKPQAPRIEKSFTGPPPEEKNTHVPDDSRLADGT